MFLFYNYFEEYEFRCNDIERGYVMKYNLMKVTYWFNEIENVKEYQSILDKELNDIFSPFNLHSLIKTSYTFSAFSLT